MFNLLAVFPGLEIKSQGLFEFHSAALAIRNEPQEILCALGCPLTKPHGLDPRPVLMHYKQGDESKQDKDTTEHLQESITGEGRDDILAWNSHTQ